MESRTGAIDAADQNNLIKLNGYRHFAEKIALPTGPHLFSAVTKIRPHRI
jgi:hypothetical protein